MTWTKLGHEWAAKSEDLSVEAALAHVELLMFSNDRGLDLIVPKVKLGKLPHPPSSRTVAELVAAGVWEDIPPLIDPDGREVEAAAIRAAYRPEWQLPATFVEHQRKQAAVRQERQRRHNSGDHGICTERCKSILHDHERGDHVLCQSSEFATCSITDPSASRRDSQRQGITRDPARSRLGSASPRTTRQEEEVVVIPDQRDDEPSGYSDDDPWFGSEETRGSWRLNADRYDK